LGEDVDADHGVGDAFRLNFGGVLESAIYDSSLELGFQKKFLEAAGLDGSVVAMPTGESVT